MNTKFNSEENFNELVFENKNKAYGAYAIRKSYHDNVTVSLILSSALFGLLALLAIFLTSAKVEVPDFGLTNDPPAIPSIVEIVIQPKDPIIKPVEKPKSDPVTNSGQLKVTDDPQKTDLKTNDQLVISKNPNPLGDSADVKMKDPVIPETKLPAEIILIPDKMPRMENMAQFIVDNLKYPGVAVENGTHGAVYLSFVVEVDGTLTDIKLKNGIGDGCEQEAQRVVKKMPLWEPGIKGGKAVRVQCTLPINFKLK